MKGKTKTFFVGLAIASVAMFGVLAISAKPALATGDETTGSGLVCPADTPRAGESVTSLAQCNVEKKEGDDSLLGRVNIIINVALGLIGVFAVVTIIYGGFAYINSRGDAEKLKKSKNTLLYGIIGLVVSLLAFAIVNFVLGNVFSGDSSSRTDDSLDNTTSSNGIGAGTATQNSTDSDMSETGTKVNESDFERCKKKKEHSTCKVNGTEYVRLKDGNLWTRSWDSSITTFDKYKNYSCPAGKKPNKKVLETLISKYSGGDLNAQLSQVPLSASGNVTTYWSITKSDSDNIYALRANQSGATLIPLAADPDPRNGTPSYGILCYVSGV